MGKHKKEHSRANAGLPPAAPAPEPAPAGPAETRFRPGALLAAAAAVGVVGLLYARRGCPILYFTGTACPGCGMTRALLSVLRLDFAAALRWHPLVFTLPVWGLLLLPGRPGPLARPRVRAALLAAMAAAFALVYLYRMFFGDGSVVTVGIPVFWKEIRNLF